MVGPLRNRSIFVQLLGGTMAVMIVVFGLWLVVERHYVRIDDRANERRWTAAQVSVRLRAVRDLEGEGDFAPIPNGPIGPTSATGHREVMQTLKQAIDSLSRLSDGERERERRLLGAVNAYADAFEQMGEMTRRRGSLQDGGTGVDGQWRAALAQLTLVAKPLGGAVEAQAARLIQAERDVIRETVASLPPAGLALRDSLRRLGLTHPEFQAALAHADSLFAERLDLSVSIGFLGQGGLRDRMHAMADTISASVDTIIADAVVNSIAARRHRDAAMIVGLTVSIALCGLFFYYFAASVARTTRDLSDAATRVGQGAFDVRLQVEGNNELSRLAAEFNMMAENLGTIVGSVRRSGIQINTSVLEIAATSRQQQATAGEIAATTTEIGATARTISTTSAQLSQGMRDLTDAAERTAGLATAGQGGIARMTETMQQITGASDSISERLATLSEKAGSINSVVTTITKVADQTNLLSLNAAIEAEKAGEYGRGFAVVASEIRRLADQTALATGDIERIVKEMQGAVTAGVMGMEKFSDEVARGVQASGMVGQQLSEIIDQVQLFVPGFDSINTGMRAQSEGAQQISDALSQLGAAAQQTADSLTQSSRAIDQLNEASRELQAGVLRFAVGS